MAGSKCLLVRDSKLPVGRDQGRRTNRPERHQVRSPCRLARPRSMMAVKLMFMFGAERMTFVYRMGTTNGWEGEPAEAVRRMNVLSS